MSALQTVAFGAASDGSQGDSVRTGFTKHNTNVSILQAQAALVSNSATITTAQALTVAHVGKRVNINLASNGTINVPSAATCAADNVILLRNVGTTVVTLAITTGSGDTCALSKLNAGESALMDTDGVHAWTVLMRGRANVDNEVVNGNCSVGGNETVGGTFGVTGASTLTGNVTAGGTLTVTGAISANGGFSARPTFGSSTPWDTGNLASPMTLNTSQTISSPKTLTSSLTITTTPGGVFSTAPLILYPTANVGAQIGFGANNGAAGGMLGFNTTGTFALYNYNASAYAALTVSTLTQTSDELLKADIETLTGVMEKLRKLRGVSFTMKGDGSRQVGLIAQDVLPEFPELVEELPMDIDADGDAIAHQYDEDGNEIFGPSGKPESRKALGVKYQNMVGPLLQGLLETDAALQAALARIAVLESKVSA